MTSTNRTPRIWWLLLAVLASMPLLGYYQSLEKKSVLDCPADGNITVRFFYHDEENYFHFPLIFRAVTQEDTRLDTAPMGAEGRTAYISLPEMQQLLQGLKQSDLFWQESEKTEVLGSYKRLPRSDRMEILILCSKGTAIANLHPKKICDTLKPLDSALKTPRAIWELQLFRQGYGCQVPGFKYDAYPDHSH